MELCFPFSVLVHSRVASSSVHVYLATESLTTATEKKGNLLLSEDVSLEIL